MVEVVEHIDKLENKGIINTKLNNKKKVRR